MIRDGTGILRDYTASNSLTDPSSQPLSLFSSLFVLIQRESQRQSAKAPLSLQWARVMVQAALPFLFGASAELMFFLKFTGFWRRALAPREGVHLRFGGTSYQDQNVNEKAKGNSTANTAGNN